MQLNILNTEILSQVDSTFNIPFDLISKAYLQVFSKYPLEEINIVFTTSEYIQELNSRYRDINAPTDVLSFEISKNISEIYISPSYVNSTFKEKSFEEEILRLIIHGTLHILGYDHMGSMNESANEEMFVLQEELLLKFKKICSL